MFAEKQIDIQGVLASTSTVINLEININGKNILTPVYILQSTQKVKKPHFYSIN